MTPQLIALQLDPRCDMNTFSPQVRFFCEPGKKRIERLFGCQFKTCGQSFNRFIKWQEHGSHHRCLFCSKYYARIAKHSCNLQSDIVGHGMTEAVSLDLEILNTNTLKYKSVHHAGTLLMLEYKYEEIVDNFSDGVEIVYPDLTLIFTHLLAVYGNFKCAVYFDTMLENYELQLKRARTFYSPAMIYSDKSLIFGNLQNAVQYLVTGLEYSSNTSGSGWILSSVLRCELRVSKYTPFKPKEYIPYAKEFKKYERYCFNIRTNNDCFRLSVVAGLYEKQIVRLLFPECNVYNDMTKNMRRRYKRYIENPSSYNQIMNVLKPNISTRRCQSLDDIHEFESESDCSVLVLKFEQLSGQFRILKPVVRKRERHVDLLLFTQNLGNKEISHYVLVRNLRGLVGTSCSKVKDVCRMCLQPLKVTLAKHMESCAVEGNQIYRFPKGPKFVFRKNYMKIPVAYLIFYKINTFCVPVAQPVSCDTLRYSTPSANLEAASYCIVVVGPTRKKVFETYFDGENVMESFLDTILSLSNKYRLEITQNAIPLIDTPQFQSELESIRECPICKDGFTKSHPVRHHSHSVPLEHLNDSNSYMANHIICNNCNLQLVQKAVCCIGYNTSKLEHHFIVKSLKHNLIKNVRIVCKNSESVLALIINQVTFIDFKMFLDFSFQDIVSRQSKSFACDTQAFPLFSSNCLIEFKHINTIPYKWMKDKSCLHATFLPDREYFRDIYTDETISEEDYLLACNTFALGNDYRAFLREYSRSRVYLLCDVAISLSNFLQREFSLFPFHSVTIHSYNFEAFASSLDHNTWSMVPDAKMLRFIASGVHGGLLTSNIRLSTSNSEIAGNFNGIPSDRKHIINLDIASCYGSECLQKVGCKDMRFLTRSEVSEFNLGFLCSETKGYLLRVYVSVPGKYHQDQSSLPLLYGKRRVCANEMDESQRTLFHSLNSIFTETSREMLILDLKAKWVTVHSRTLKYWIDRGIVLHQIDEILEFTETDFIAPYMRKVLNLRQEAAAKGDDIFNLFLKTMANSLVGKLASNTQRMYNYILSVSSSHSLKLAKKGTFDTFFPISENVVLFQMKRQIVSHTGCLLSAVCIYANSKLRMFQNFRDLQLAFPCAEVIYCDTDGYIASVPDPEGCLNEYFASNKKEYDFSKLDQSHPLHSEENKNKPGKWRVVDTDIQAIVCVRPKCYSILRKCKCESYPCICHENKNSGLRTEKLRKLNFWYYLLVLVQNGVRYFTDNILKSVSHNVQLTPRRAIGFTTLNMSRYLLEDKINTRPYGYAPED